MLQKIKGENEILGTGKSSKKKGPGVSERTLYNMRGKWMYLLSNNLDKSNMLKKRELEIIPTIWIQEDQNFYELVRQFYLNGIRKLRVNCTRYSMEKYIKDIICLREICSRVTNGGMEIITDLPYPRKKSEYINIKVK